MASPQLNAQLRPWLYFAMLVSVVAWCLFFVTERLKAHEDLEGHPEIQREFKVIQDRYLCLQDFPEQTPEDLAYCDEYARNKNPMPR